MSHDKMHWALKTQRYDKMMRKNASSNLLYAQQLFVYIRVTYMMLSFYKYHPTDYGIGQNEFK